MLSNPLSTITLIHVIGFHVKEHSKIYRKFHFPKVRLKNLDEQKQVLEAFCPEITQNELKSYLDFLGEIIENRFYKRLGYYLSYVYLID